MLETCGDFPGSSEEYPFGEGVAVFKVGGRMFALVPLEEGASSISLKCDPDTALELRARYPSVRPGYHLNKKHWNTVGLDGSIDAAEVRWMVEHSYGLVLAGLSRAARDRLLDR